MVSDPFAITGPGAIPAARFEVDGDTLAFSFEPYFRNAPNPDPGTTVPVTFEGPTTTTREATFGDRGLFTLDIGDLPGGEYTVSVPEGAWTDPDGNPSAAIGATVTLD